MCGALPLTPRVERRRASNEEMLSKMYDDIIGTPSHDTRHLDSEDERGLTLESVSVTTTLVQQLILSVSITPQITVNDYESFTLQRQVVWDQQQKHGLT